MAASAAATTRWSGMTAVPLVSPLTGERRSPEGEHTDVEQSHGGALSRRQRAFSQSISSAATSPSSGGPQLSSSPSRASKTTATRRSSQVPASAVERWPTAAALRRSGVVENLPVSKLIGSAQQNSRLAAGQLKALDGLLQLCRWIEDRNLKRAAVTNAPRANAELTLLLLGLTQFFPMLVIGSECDRAKPFPDPYLKALQLIGASPEHTFVFEDSASGIRAGVAAGMPVVGLTTGNPEKVLNDAGASLLIKDFRDPKLLSMLEELEDAAARAQGGSLETHK